MDTRTIAVAVLIAIFFGLVIGGFIGVLQSRETNALGAFTGAAWSAGQIAT